MSRSIKIVIIIAILLVVGVTAALVIPALFRSENIPAEVNTITQSMLPHGTRLDFSTVRKYNPDNKLFSYPLTTPLDVGSSLDKFFQNPQ